MSNPEKWEIEFYNSYSSIWTRVTILGVFPSESDARVAAYNRAKVDGYPRESYRVRRAESFVVVSRDLAGEFTLQCDEEFFTKEEAEEFIQVRAKTLGVPVKFYMIQPRF